MANLNKRRGMPGVAVFQECIYAVGGHDTPGNAIEKIRSYYIPDHFLKA